MAQFEPLGQAKLTAVLEKLEATASDAITRWSCADEYAKVDLVVSKLLKEGNVEAALLYVRKVCTTSCTSLGDESHLSSNQTSDE